MREPIIIHSKKDLKKVNERIDKTGSPVEIKFAPYVGFYYHWVLLREAEKRAIEAQKYFNKLCERMKKVPPENEIDWWQIHKKSIGKKFYNERMNSILAIILSVSALDSFVNSMAHNVLFKDTWKLINYDRIEKKFKIILDIWKNMDINIDSINEDFNNMKEVIQWRNRIIHFEEYKYTKSKQINHPGGIKVYEDYNFINSKNALYACKTIKFFFESIEETYSSYSLRKNVKNYEYAQ